MKRVGLIGFYGWGNYGDELMLGQWRRAFTGVAETEVVHSLLHRPYFTESATDVARRYDALVIGGGDLLSPDSISSLYWNRAWTERPVVITGVGVCLERPGYRADVMERLRRFMTHENVRSVTTRDVESSDWVRKHLKPCVDVGTAADIGFAVPLPSPSLPRSCVGIVFRKTPTSTDADLLRKLRTQCAEAGVELEVLMLSMGLEQDREFEGLRATLGDVPELFRTQSIEEMTRRISSYMCIFTAKFHGAVIAARYGIPAISIRETHKIAALARQIGEHRVVQKTDWWDDSHTLSRRTALPREPVYAAERSAAEAVRHTVDLVMNS